MIPDWQMTLIKRSALSQLRPDQITWFDKYKTIPTEVMAQFAFSPEGAALMQQAVDVIITGTDAMFARVAQIQQAQMAMAAPAPVLAQVQSAPVQTAPVPEPTPIPQAAPAPQVVQVAPSPQPPRGVEIAPHPQTGMPYIKQ